MTETELAIERQFQAMLDDPEVKRVWNGCSEALQLLTKTAFEQGFIRGGIWSLDQSRGQCVSE